MATREGSVLHQQALTVSGLLTGLTLTALVLILNSPRSFQAPIGPVSGDLYFEILVTYVALLGSLSSLAMVAFLEIAGGLAETMTPLDSLATVLFLITVFGFLGVLPLLLAPFSRNGAGIVLIVDVILVASYAITRRRPPRSPR